MGRPSRRQHWRGGARSKGGADALLESRRRVAPRRAGGGSRHVGDGGGGSRAGLAGWEEKFFKGQTRYAVVDATPYLTWTWRIEGTLAGLDETTKAGDDYPARVYVIVSGGALLWRTRTLSYVWSSGRPEGATWPNAFAPRSVTMLAVDSGPARAGRWVTRARNVAEDLRRYLGVERPRVDAVAIMTDTDNSGQRARAFYGDIRFTAESPGEAAPAR